MKHLVFILMQLYPNRHFRICEDYRTDEVYNIDVIYHLTIEGICYNQAFKSFQELENYILKLYNKENYE